MDWNEKFVKIPYIPWMNELFNKGRVEVPGMGEVTLSFNPGIDILHDELNWFQRAAITYLLLSGLGNGLALALSADNRNCYMNVRALTAYEKEIIEEEEKRRLNGGSNFFLPKLPPEGERLLVISSNFDAQPFLKLFSALSVERSWMNDNGEEDSSSTQLFGGMCTLEREGTSIHVINMLPTISEEWSLLEFLNFYFEEYIDDYEFSDGTAASKEFFDKVVFPAVSDWEEDYTDALREKSWT